MLFSLLFCRCLSYLKDCRWMEDILLLCNVKVALPTAVSSKLLGV